MEIKFNLINLIAIKNLAEAEHEHPVNWLFQKDKAMNIIEMFFTHLCFKLIVAQCLK